MATVKEPAVATVSVECVNGAVPSNSPGNPVAVPPEGFPVSGSSSFGFGSNPYVKCTIVIGSTPYNVASAVDAGGSWLCSFGSIPTTQSAVALNANLYSDSSMSTLLASDGPYYVIVTEGTAEGACPLQQARKA